MNEDKASRYHRLKRRTAVIGAAGEGLLAAGLMVSGASVVLRHFASSWAGSWVGTTVAYGVILGAASLAVQGPAAFYGQVVLERRYGLLTQSTGRWLADHAKGAILGLLVAVVAAVVVVGLLRTDLVHWWIAAGTVLTVLLLLVAGAAPVLLPLVHVVTPIRRESLVSRLKALAVRAGAPVTNVLEWRLSDHTRKANAALTGLGRARRILISDTLLADHSEEEIEVVVAHELAHHVHRDIWTVLALESGLLFAGLYASDAALRWLVEPLGLEGRSDVAALPIVVVAMGATSIAGRPLLNALSRLQERRADRYALELTRNVDGFVAAMRRLAALNLAEDRPSRLVELFFHTHPSAARRIASAQQWSRLQTPRS